MEGLRKHRTTLLCATFTTLYTAGTTIASVPLLRLWELSLCRSYYLEHDATLISSTGYVEESSCKIDDVQSPLASLQGFDALFWAITGLLVTPIYTYVSARCNRKKIILLGLVGYLLSQLYVGAICYFYHQFSIKLVWLSCLSTLIGGGPMVTISLVQAIVADQIDPALLSSYFNYTRAASLIVDILAYGVAAYLMGRNVWLPVPLGLVIYLLCIPLLVLIKDRNDTSYMALTDEEDFSKEGDVALGTLTTAPDAEKQTSRDTGGQRGERDEDSSPRSMLGVGVHFVKSSCRTFWDLIAHDGVTRLTFLVFFLDALATNVQDIGPQWASKNLKWTIAETEYLRSYQSAVGGVTLLLLPLVTRYMHKRSFSSPSTNYLIAKCSLFAFTVGCFGFGISWTRVVFIISSSVFRLGVGYHDAVKSYASAMVQPDQITQLYIGIAAAARLGNLVGGPLWSQCFVLGMSAGRYLSGLPFLVAVPVWLAGWAALSRLRNKHGREPPNMAR